MNRTALLLIPTAIFMYACGGNNSVVSNEAIGELKLKSGEVISCGPADQEFGTVNFELNYDEKLKGDFNRAVELLHSFEYEESEKVFAKIIAESPNCAMAYWGVAMCSFHPLWEPPSEADLKKGSKAIEIANSITPKSELESGFINSVAAYYKDWEKTNPVSRSLNFEKAMEQLHAKYPNDKEAAIFYSLALVAAASPADKSFTKQKKAGEILNSLYKSAPNHPGIIHYIIHTYDYPGLATLGLTAAKRYAQVAPSSSHALHMPSHIFTRLGLWDDCINLNRRAAEAAKCYAESSGFKGHWDEELHDLDYIVYAYLQKGDNDAALEQLTYIESIKQVYPLNFKVAYTFAASPSRYVLENREWDKAMNLQIRTTDFPWIEYPWQEAIIHFARLLGAANAANLNSAESELAKLNELHARLQKANDSYKSNQVAIQIKTGEAWIAFRKGKKAEGLNLMKSAADMEDSTSKHPVTPGEVLPARELYADMLLQAGQYENALQSYEQALQKSANRFNSLNGAGLAAEKVGETEKAVFYYKQLMSIAAAQSKRQELAHAAAIVKKYN